MNIECNDLATILEKASIAVDTHASRTVFGKIRLLSRGNFLVAACFNGELYLETWCDRNGQENVNCVIDINKLLKLAQLGGTATMKINKGSITFKSEHVKRATIPIQDHGEFPDFPDEKVGGSLILTKREIQNLRSAANVTSGAVNMQCLQATLVEEKAYISLINGEGRSVTIVKDALICPDMFINLGQLAKLASFGSCRLELSTETGKVFVSGDRYRAWFAATNAIPLNPSTYISFEPQHVIEVQNPGLIKDELSAIIMFSKEGSPSYITYKDGKLSISAFGGQDVELRIDAKVTAGNGDFEECFSASNILGAISALGNEYEICLLHHPRDQECLWMRIQSENIYHYFMPMVAKGAKNENDPGAI